MAAAIPVQAGAASPDPDYRIVTRFQAPQGAPGAGMPGPYPGKVIRTHSEKCIDTRTSRVDVPVVREMISRGMRGLTSAKTDREAWARFFGPKDVVGIKVNCSGAPQIMSTPEIVAEIAANLVALGIPARNIYIYERFLVQLLAVPYKRFVPEGVDIVAAEGSRGSLLGYDPRTYVEVNFFGEDDTRSNMFRYVTERFTKIINVPNLKDHGASGVTGCLKNIAYGSFSNVARSHNESKTNTLTFIGKLATVEPLRSRTVLQIMDGLRGVWQGGPFAPDPKYMFFPKQMMFATDPVAIDRIELDLVEAKRKAEGALSLFDRSERNIGKVPSLRVNPFIREPGHIEYAAGLGLGISDLSRIRLTEIEI